MIRWDDSDWRRGILSEQDWISFDGSRHRTLNVGMMKWGGSEGLGGILSDQKRIRAASRRHQRLNVKIRE